MLYTQGHIKWYTICMKRLILIALLLTGCGEIGYYGKPAHDGDTVYYGDSITAFCGPNTLNRATPGDTTMEMLDKVKHFANRDGNATYNVLIGVNDIIKGVDEGYIGRLDEIFTQLKGRRVTVTGILPTAYGFINKKAITYNGSVKALAEIYGFSYRDLSRAIGLEHLSDGLHLNKSGCEVLHD